MEIVGVVRERKRKNQEPRDKDTKLMNGANNSLSELRDKTEEVCPYLGLYQDPETRYGYPALGNYCHRGKLAKSISFSHQEQVCLTAEYTHCPVYSSKGKKPFPAELHGEGLPSLMRRGFSWWWLILVGVGVVVTVWGFWFSGKLPFFLTTTLTQEESAQSTESVVGIKGTTSISAYQEDITPALPSATPSPSITPTPIIPFTSTSTPTASPTPGPEFGTPFGNQEIYVLINVSDGDSLGKFAYLYETSEDVIRAANDIPLGRGIWPGDLLVIPIGQSDPSQVNSFKPIYLDHKTSVYDLSARYAVTAEDIQFYNDVGVDEYIPAGRWLIVPVSGE